MNSLLTALAATEQALAAQLGVTVRTVRRWVDGTHQPNRRNRAALSAIVAQAYREHSAAGHRWSERRDAQLAKVTHALKTNTERQAAEAFRDQMTAAFASNTIAYANETYDQWRARMATASNR